LFNKLLLPIFIVSLLVSACGFQPLYAKRANSSGEIATTNQLLASVQVESIENREGQILRNLLLDRLNSDYESAPIKYHLTSKISITTSGLGVQSDDTTNRNKLTVTAQFNLIGSKKNRKFYITQISSYSETESEYPALVAKQDAINRNLREIANDAKIRISLFLELDRNSEQP